VIIVGALSALAGISLAQDKFGLKAANGCRSSETVSSIAAGRCEDYLASDLHGSLAAPFRDSMALTEFFKRLF
jgi:hypothetical protein